jgi:dolichol kinase
MISQGAILNDPEDDDVRTMSRTSSPSELLYGPLQMTLIMCYVGLLKFMTHSGILMMASLVGDGVAAIVGMQYGRHVYKVPLGSEKSVEGTIGCAIGTMGGIWFFSYMCGIEMMADGSVVGEGGGGGGWKTYLAYGCLSAAVEAAAIRNWDNLLLALAMELSATHHQHFSISQHYSAVLFSMDRIRGWLSWWKNG